MYSGTYGFIYQEVKNNTNYRGYTLQVSQEIKLFGARVCFIKRAGFTVDKAVGSNEEAAIATAKLIVDYWLK